MRFKKLFQSIITEFYTINDAYYIFCKILLHHCAGNTKWELSADKTFLFIAYSGEGYEGVEPVSSGDVKRFLDAKYGFSSAYEIEAVVELRGLGVGDGGELLLASGGSLRLAQHFQSISRRLRVPARITREEIDLSRIFSAGSPLDSGEEAPRVKVYREGWEATSRTAADQLESISVENLEEAGRVISLSLMIMGRETDY